MCREFLNNKTNLKSVCFLLTWSVSLNNVSDTVLLPVGENHSESHPQPWYATAERVMHASVALASDGV